MQNFGEHLYQLIKVVSCNVNAKYLIEGAMKEDAALWRTLVPINRIKETLSCSKTSFTVVPDNTNTQEHYTYDLSIMKSQR